MFKKIKPQQLLFRIWWVLSWVFFIAMASGVPWDICKWVMYLIAAIGLTILIIVVYTGDDDGLHTI